MFPAASNPLFGTRERFPQFYPNLWPQTNRTIQSSHPKTPVTFDLHFEPHTSQNENEKKNIKTPTLFSANKHKNPEPRAARDLFSHNTRNGMAHVPIRWLRAREARFKASRARIEARPARARMQVIQVEALAWVSSALGPTRRAAKGPPGDSSGSFSLHETGLVGFREVVITRLTEASEMTDGWVVVFLLRRRRGSGSHRVWSLTSGWWAFDRCKGGYARNEESMYTSCREFVRIVFEQWKLNVGVESEVITRTWGSPWFECQIDCLPSSENLIFYLLQHFDDVFRYRHFEKKICKIWSLNYSCFW